MARFAARVDVAVLLAFVGPPAADLEEAAERDAVAAGDLRDVRFGAVAVGAYVDAFDLDRHDEGGRHRDVRVEVGEDGRVAVLARPVEDRDRRVDRDRFLFGEGDDAVPVALADDRAGAALARGGHGRGLELATAADGQAEGLQRAVFVVFERDPFDHRRQRARHGGDFAATADGDRCVVEPRQRARLEVAVAVDDQVAGTDPQGIRAAGCDQHRKRQDHRQLQLHPAPPPTTRSTPS